MNLNHSANWMLWDVIGWLTGLVVSFSYHQLGNKYYGKYQLTKWPKLSCESSMVTNSKCLLLFLFFIYKSDSLRITLMLKKLNVTCWNKCVIKISTEWYKLQIIKYTPRMFTNIFFTFVKKYNLLVYSLINESRLIIF